MGILRLILALVVVMGHSRGTLFGGAIFGGDLAVQSFFIFSGFYISLVWTEKYSLIKNGKKQFYQNRFLRLLPSYWLIALLTLTALFTIGIAPYSHLPVEQIWERFAALPIISQCILSLTNIFMIGQDWVMYWVINPGEGITWTTNFRNTDNLVWQFLLLPQGWSLGIELTFYLLAPYILKRSFFLVFGILLSSVALRIILYSNGLNFDPWTYRFFPTELTLFMMGNLSYRFYHFLNFNKKWISKVKVIGYLFVLFSLIGVLKFHYFPVDIQVKKWMAYICFMFAIPFMFICTRYNKIDRFLGDMAYPVYINHLLILLCFKYYFDSKNMWEWVTLSSIIMAALMVVFIETPITNYRHKTIKQKIMM